MEQPVWFRISTCEACVTQAFNRILRFSSLSFLFRCISRLGNGVFWYTLIIVLYLIQGPQALLAIVQMIVTGLTATILFKWLKQKTVRPRPYAQFPHIRCLIAPLDQFSFPSGHTLHAVTFSIVAIVYYPVLTWLLIPFTVLVAISRLVLGLHYLTDVLAGALIGGAVAGASFLVF